MLPEHDGLNLLSFYTGVLADEFIESHSFGQVVKQDSQRYACSNEAKFTMHDLWIEIQDSL